MSDFVYKNHIPANSRVIVDYNSKEKVKFSYPKKWTYRKAVWAQAYPTIMQLWVIIHIMILVYSFLYLMIPGLLIYSAFFYEQPVVQEDIAEVVEPEQEEKSFVDENKWQLLFSFYIFGLPFLFTLITSRNKEKFSVLLPKIGYLNSKLAGSIKETTFEPKHIKDNKVAIPTFSNVFLEYRCKGDFSDKLEKIVIMEIPFVFKKRNFFLPFRKSKEINDSVFSALFYFSSAPKNGRMEVEFS